MQLLYLGPPETLEYIQSLLPKFDIQLALDDDTVDRMLPTCDVILDAYMRVRFPASRLMVAPLLKLFTTATTGADHIDAEALAQRQIPLLTLKGQREVLKNITPAAEHSWLLLMACARRFAPAIRGVLAGEWNRNLYPGIMLRGKTLGVIGCGRIGEWMSKYAAAFGMRCIGYDPYVAPWPATIERRDLDSLLGEADFISIHVTLSEDTRALLGQRELGLVKPGAILINTSRGEIIDQNALLAALTTQRLAAAGLDVVTGEPEIAHHPLVKYAREHDNLLITPHIGGYSPDALQYVLEFSCKRIVNYFGMNK